MARFWFVCVFLLALVISSWGMTCPERCTCSIFGVKCTGLTQIPSNYFPELDVSSLKIEDSIIGDIEESAFENISVSYFTFKNVTIKNVRDNAFTNISVSHMGLSQFKVERFASFAMRNIDVSYLKISSGTIGVIQSDAFKNASVTHLTVWSTNISVVETNAFNNMSVSHFRMYDMGVTTIKTNAFSGNLMVLHFNFYNSSISNLEDFAFNFTRDTVTHSSLYNTVIQRVGCHALDGLVTTRNLIKPPCGSDTTSVTTSDTTSDTNTFSTSPCPERCFCNGLRIFCSEISAFPDLTFNDAEILTINNSTFAVPIDAFEGLPNLKTIAMDHVYMTDIGSCAFRGMTGGSISLQNSMIGANISQGSVFCDLDQMNFYISGVIFPSMAQQTFHNVSTTFFEIDRSNITDIHSLAFSDVKAHSIRILNTSIGTIHPNAFNNLDALHMSLFNSSVKTIQSNAFDNMNATNLHLYNLNVTTIQTRAFGENLTASFFKIFNSAITNLEDNAFSFSNETVRYSRMYNTVVTNPGCHALDGLGTTSNLQMPAPCGPVNSAVSGFLAGHMMFLSLLVLIKALV